MTISPLWERVGDVASETAYFATFERLSIAQSRKREEYFDAARRFMSAVASDGISATSQRTALESVNCDTARKAFLSALQVGGAYLNCEKCGRIYEQARISHRFCSRRCAAATGEQRRRLEARAS